MPNWIPIVAATLAAIPAAAAFFVAYGRYDGVFQDRVVFLYFIGGMLLGFFVSVISLFFLVSAIGPSRLFLAVIGLALLLPISVVAMVNRRKWQGLRHSVFNGGAAGLGFSVMMGFSMLFFQAQGPYNADLKPLTDAWVAANKTGPAPTLETASYAFDPTFLGQGALLAIGLTGLFFGIGLIAGNAVRLRKQFRWALLATVIIFPAMVFLEELFSPVRSGKWTWTALIAAYGLIFGVLTERKLLIEGVEEDDRKKRRRLRRKAAQP